MAETGDYDLLTYERREKLGRVPADRDKDLRFEIRGRPYMLSLSFLSGLSSGLGGRRGCG